MLKGSETETWLNQKAWGYLYLKVFMHYYTLYDHIIRYYFDYYQKNVIAATFQ